MQTLTMLLGLIDLRAFLMVALIFIPLERLVALRHDQSIFRAKWGYDLIYTFANKILVALGLAVVVILIGGALSALLPDGVPVWVAALPLLVQVLAAIVIADIGFYAAHRLFHTVPWLWRFHAVHHSIEELDWLAAARVHPIDQIITKGTSILPLFVLGISSEALAVYGVIYLFHSHLLHANVHIPFGPLRWLVASPEFHHWHHANQKEAYDKNFSGQLVLLDILFRTAHMPKGERPTRYGVDDPIPGNYLLDLAYPFKRPAPAEPAAEPLSESSSR